MGAYSNLIQSKYYCRSFNSAVFDGTVRIYFSPPLEPFALNLYFQIQQQLEKELQVARELSRKSGKNIYILIYPDRETLFSTLKMEDELRPLFFETWEDKGFMYFFAGELDDINRDELIFSIKTLINSWEKIVSSSEEELTNKNSSSSSIDLQLPL